MVGNQYKYDIAEPAPISSSRLQGHESMNRAGMPTESEINRQFIEVVKELELSVERQVALFALPIEKKWLMIQAKHNDQNESKGATDYPDYYIDSIKRYSHRRVLVTKHNLEAVWSFVAPDFCYFGRFLSSATNQNCHNLIMIKPIRFKMFFFSRLIFYLVSVTTKTCSSLKILNPRSIRVD